MGAEARCAAVFDGASSEGTALLETDALVFRGRRRLSISYEDMREVRADGGRLTVTTATRTAVFELGASAEPWAHRIRNPKSRLDKLGVKPGHVVVVIGLDDPPFVAELTERAGRVRRRPAKDADIVFVGADVRSDLDRLERLMGYLRPNGALWVIRPKGGRAITESDVLAGGKAAGLVDVKVVRFSETHTAEKFVIPVAARPKRS